MIPQNSTLGSLRTVWLAAIVAAMCCSSMPRAHAGEQVPFVAVFQTEAESTVNFPIASVQVLGEGHATSMGLTSTATTNQVVNLITGAGTATYRLIAANGDTLNVEFVFTALPLPTEPGLSLNGTWTVVSGTGRFTGATGSGTTTGSVHFTTQTAAVGQFTMTGTISSPGSAK